MKKRKKKKEKQIGHCAFLSFESYPKHGPKSKKVLKSFQDYSATQEA